MAQVDDILSPFVRKVLGINIEAAYTRLVPTGDGNPQAREILTTATPDTVLVQPVTRLDDAKALLAGLWLWHDWLGESHTISQGIISPTGSFWHAIMHRREGDFSNSKYWYARCAGHPVLQVMAAQSPGVLNSQAPHKSLLRLMQGGWSPNAFVDLVEEVHDQPTDAHRAAAVSLQQLEWRLLFDHCSRAAGG